MATRSLGALTLDLLIKTGAFVAGMDKAERATLKSTKAMQKRLDDFAKGIGKAVGAATIAGAALGGLYIKNTLEAEKVSAKLNARIAALGGTAAVSAKQVNALADSLQAATTFDDEAITEASTALLAFTNVGADQFARTLAASLDLAAASGDDLTLTAEKLGKALNAPAQAAKLLRADGIALTESQKDLIKALTDAGRVSEAQEIILVELEKRYKGTAEAARNTLGGALTALKNTFNNLLEGDSSGDGMKGAITAVNSFNDSLNDPAIKSGIDAIAGAVAGLTAELVAGIAQFASYISRTRELAALANDPKLAKNADLDVLNERIGENAQQRRRVQNQRTSVLGFDLPSLVAERKQALKDLDAERLILQREVTQRIKQDAASNLFDGVTATVLRDPVPTGGNGKGKGNGAGSAEREAAKAAAEAKKQAEEAAEAIREAQEAQYDWHQTVLDMQASLEGPVAEVNRDYEKQILNLDAAFAAGEVTLADYAKAQELIAEQRDQSIKKIEDELTPLEEVNAAIQEQIMLLGMSAEEQEIYNNLKAAGVDANSEFGKSIIDSTRDLQAGREAMDEQIEAMDAIRDAGKGLFRDLVDGSKSFKDAFTDALDSIQDRILDMIAENLMDQLFGQQGQPAGGSTGNFWANLLGAFFGGGKASGGSVGAGKFYRVNENGPEMLSVSGKDYLMMGPNNGTVTPNNRLSSGGGVTQIFNNPVLATRNSVQQLQQEAGIKQRIAMARNG